MRMMKERVMAIAPDFPRIRSNLEFNDQAVAVATRDEA